MSQIQNAQNASREIFVKSDLKYVRINLEEVYHVEAMADYVVINLQEKKHIVHSTMKAMASKLPDDLFVRVHRSYIINMHQVASVENNVIKMNNGFEVPLGASYKSDFISRLNFL